MLRFGLPNRFGRELDTLLEGQENANLRPDLSSHIQNF